MSTWRQGLDQERERWRTTQPAPHTEANRPKLWPRYHMFQPMYYTATCFPKFGQVSTHYDTAWGEQGPIGNDCDPTTLLRAALQAKYMCGLGVGETGMVWCCVYQDFGDIVTVHATRFVSLGIWMERGK